jgi:hypothetical protein
MWSTFAMASFWALGLVVHVIARLGQLGYEP